MASFSCLMSITYIFFMGSFKFYLSICIPFMFA